MKKKKFRNSIRTLTLSAMLVALSILFAGYAKTVPDTFLRFSFENLPIIFGAVLFGPWQGAAIAISSDIISCTIVGGYAPNPILMLGIVSLGLTAGFVAKLFGPKRFLPLPLLPTVFLSHIIGNMIIKSIGLYYMGYLASFKILLLSRIPNYMVIATLEYIALLLLFRNATIQKLAKGEMKK